jgi:hypothetical protein
MGLLGIVSRYVRSRSVRAVLGRTRLSIEILWDLLERAKGFEPSTPTLARLFWHFSDCFQRLPVFPNSLTIKALSFTEAFDFLPQFSVGCLPIAYLDPHGLHQSQNHQTSH